MIVDVIGGAPKLDLLVGGSRSVVLEEASEILQAIAKGAYRTKPRDEIRGSGYVVECLEAALWCFDRADRYE
jgi:ADP-ribosyl-[dinitrogen reductase] hydrolase